MVRQIRRVVTIVVGVSLLAIGVVGGFIPVFQGWIFVLLGLMVLAKEVPLARYYVQQLKRRYPKQAAQMHRARERFFPSRAGRGTNKKTDTSDP